MAGMLLTVLLVAIITTPVIAYNQTDILMEFYTATGGPNWINDDNWGIDPDYCNWFGITCTLDCLESRKRSTCTIDVTSISLSGNGLVGSISSSFLDLTTLVHVDLSSSRLIGSLQDLFSGTPSFTTNFTCTSFDEPYPEWCHTCSNCDPIVTTTTLVGTVSSTSTAGGGDSTTSSTTTAAASTSTVAASVATSTASTTTTAGDSAVVSSTVDVVSTSSATASTTTTATTTVSATSTSSVVASSTTDGGSGATSTVTTTSTSTSTTTGSIGHNITAVRDTIVIRENSPRTTIDVLANDFAYPSAGVTLTVVNASTISPSIGITSFNGSFVFFTPATNFIGSLRVNYTITGLPLYAPIVITNNDGGYTSCPASYSGGPTVSLGLAQCDVSDALYYLKDCLEAGFYGTSICLPCPTGATCPGGNRLWALPGYWNPDKHSIPVPCTPASACPGSNVSSICADGYEGVRCSSCNDAYFRASSLDCLPCKSGGTQTVTVVILVACVFFGLVMIAVILLHDNYLDTLVSMLVALQQLIQIGQTASAKLGSTAQSVFSYLSLVLFDYNFIRPGCSIGQVSFTAIYSGTIIIILAFGLLFTLGALLRSYFLFRTISLTVTDLSSSKQSDEFFMKKSQVVFTNTLGLLRKKMLTASRVKRFLIQLIIGKGTGSDFEKNLNWKEIFVRRAIRSNLILITIVYYIIALRTFQSIDCVEDPNAGRLDLRIEASIQCYRSTHQVMSIFTWSILVLIMFGFPVVCAYLVFGGRKRLTERSYSERFGFLYSGLRPNASWFRLTAFVVNILVAAQTAFQLNLNAQILINIACSLVNFVLVIIFQPYRNNYLNAIFLLGGFGRAVYLLALLALTNFGSPYFWAVLACAALMTVLSLIKIYVWVATKLLPDSFFPSRIQRFLDRISGIDAHSKLEELSIPLETTASVAVSEPNPSSSPRVSDRIAFEQ